MNQIWNRNTKPIIRFLILMLCPVSLNPLSLGSGEEGGGGGGLPLSQKVLQNAYVGLPEN